MHEGDVEKIIGLLEDIASSSAEMNRFLSEYISSVDKLLENISNTLDSIKQDTKKLASK